MSESEDQASYQASYRASIAARNRKSALDERERRISILVTGLLGYSAFSNFFSGAVSIFALPLDAALCFLLGALYSLGVYRVYFKDDTRWWPVAVPAGLAIGILLLAWLGGMPRPIPLLLNIGLLVLVPIRRHAFSAAARGA